MGYKIIEKEWNETTGDYYCKFICDTVEDIADLPACNSGSVAVVVAEGSPVHVVNASGEWKEISSANGGGSSGGIKPEGTITITENGTHDVTEYASAEVNVASGGGGDTQAIIDSLIDRSVTEISTGVEEISSFAFYGSKNLTNVNMPNVTVIGSSAFGNCENLALTELPSGVTYISSGAFSDCDNLALTELPSGVTHIGSSAFQSCISLASIELPSSLTKIDGSAFSSCSNLQSVTFKGTPTSIHSYAFSQCHNLKTINVPWAEGAVKNAPWGATNATINYNYTGV